jgi:hypothetical protein
VQQARSQAQTRVFDRLRVSQCGPGPQSHRERWPGLPR